MKKQSKASKQDLLHRATCPECWQTIHVHDNQTYFAHGKLRDQGQEPRWCSLSTRPIQPLFALGQQIFTVGAIEALWQARQDPEALLNRHQHGDWGELSPEDAQENILGVQQGYRLLSVYTLKTGVKIRVITEADRSATTLRLPDEDAIATGANPGPPPPRTLDNRNGSEGPVRDLATIFGNGLKAHRRQ